MDTLMTDMTEWFLALVPTDGLWLLASLTFLACLALQVLCAVLMLSADGCAVSGDLVLWEVIAAARAAARAGAIIGDAGLGLVAAGELKGCALAHLISWLIFCL